MTHAMRNRNACASHEQYGPSPLGRMRLKTDSAPRTSPGPGANRYPNIFRLLWKVLVGSLGLAHPTPLFSSSGAPNRCNLQIITAHFFLHSDAVLMSHPGRLQKTINKYNHLKRGFADLIAGKGSKRNQRLRAPPTRPCLSGPNGCCNMRARRKTVKTLSLSLSN